MRAVSGVFVRSSDGVKAAEQLVSRLGRDHVNLLTPDLSGEKPKDVPTTEDMPPVGGAMGGVVGGALGAATAFAIPGIGTIAVFGAAAAALVGGAAVGWKIGDAADRASSAGLPVDELYVYEDALRQGRTVVIAMVDDKEEEDSVREILDDSHAESLDAARKRWWAGLRNAEAEHYESQGIASPVDENAFRRGFEAALSPWVRGRTYREAIDILRSRHPVDYDKDNYQRGYERGREYLTSSKKGLW